MTATVRHLAQAGALLALLIVWQLAALAGLPDFILSPFQIARHFIEALGTAELYQHVWASLARALPGFAIGSFAGAMLGLAAGVARRRRLLGGERREGQHAGDERGQHDQGRREQDLVAGLHSRVFNTPTRSRLSMRLRTMRALITPAAATTAAAYR